MEYTIGVRSYGDPLRLRRQIAAALLPLSPQAPITKMDTVDQLAYDRAARERAYSIVFGLFAGLALLLSAVGIYGVMAFLVAQRSKEIGLRIALGAAPGRIAAMIFREGGALAAAGLAMGLFGASLASKTLLALLSPFDAQKYDYTAFVAASVLLLVCALAACWGPALRASEVDPIDSLRMD